MVYVCMVICVLGVCVPGVCGHCVRGHTDIWGSCNCFLYIFSISQCGHRFRVTFLNLKIVFVLGKKCEGKCV